MKVLIAEDDFAFCQSLEEDIKEWGYQVFTANNGKEAWKIIENDEIRLAILDSMISNIDGFELCRKIRRNIQENKSKNTYIILLINKDRKDDKVKGLSVGADDYLAKPFDFLDLRIRIQNGERIIKIEDSFKILATYDRLTKLLTRTRIIEFLSEELNRGWRGNHPTGLIMADIDRFKQVNDTYGHSTGDDMLIEVASRIKKAIRPYDKAGRYGGDEILLVLPNCSLSNLRAVTDRLRHTVSEKKMKTEEAILEVSLSFGATSSEISSEASVDDLIKTSDNALLLAKKKGRNWAVVAKTVYSPFSSNHK
ncbi:MAG: diguanylate cyclase [Candidatus Aminicenantes bacterium]|nr:MAG: diguanylate cyclase [Candidatus Aminicenantes bacterium]